MRTSPPTLLYHDTHFEEHDTGDHPEYPGRYRAIVAELSRRGMLVDRPSPGVNPVTDEQILRVHTPDHLRYLEEVTRAGGGWLLPDTWCGPDSLTVARFAAGAATAATGAVLQGDATRAFALGRPPGHHATAGAAMGFCLLNSVAIAAAEAIHQGAARVAIVDWDVHHGNGTQDIFYDRSDVLYCSVHQSPFYPYTGAATETGAGTGAGYTQNVPLPARSDGAAFRRALSKRFVPAIQAFRPDLLLVSAGFDAHVADPLGGMRLTDGDFLALTAIVVGLVDELCGGRLVFVLEGGYDIAALARNVANIIARLDA